MCFSISHHVLHVHWKVEEYRPTVNPSRVLPWSVNEGCLCIIGHLMYTFSSISVLLDQILRNAVYSKSHDNIPAADSCGLSY